eukprot:s3181_g9.t1
MEQRPALARLPGEEASDHPEQAITVYALRDGDINMSHLVKYCYHKDVPYYTLEFILVWPTAQGLEQLYCKHFFTVDDELYAVDLPPGWGRLSTMPTILHRVSLHCTGFKYYPFQQHSVLVHTSGATISGGNTNETNRLAWHVAYHEADTLSIGVINEQIHFDTEMSTMIRRSIPPPVTSISVPVADRKISMPANLALGRIWVHLQSAMQLADTSQELEYVKADLAEIKDRARIANKSEDINLNHLLKYWEHDDVPYYDLEVLLEWEEEDTHTLYVRHFFTRAKGLTSPDFPPNWGTLHMYPAVLQLIHLKVDSSDFYPFKQEHYKAVSKHTLATIHGQLQAAMQASKEVVAAHALNKELQEASSLAQAALEAHPIFFGLHDDYQDLDQAI